MDAESAHALSLRLLPGLLVFAQRKRWAAPRPITPRELVQFQILVAAMVITATPGAQPITSAASRDNIPRREPNIFSTLRNLDKQMDIYENRDLLDLAREQIPMERIRAEATALQQSDSPLACEQDALAQVLVHWFKHEYFKWADPIKCPRCAGPTSASGMVPPTLYEREGGAGRVELHVCRGENGACDGSFRFPRYKDLKRSQVSDENAHRKMWGMGKFVHVISKGAFSLHDLQLVWNKEDHVWNEYFSPGAGRWIHTDSCEAARDQPLLYDRGWGKKMSYIFSFSIDGASDMSRGYVQNSNEMLQRRKDAPEPALAEELAKITAARRRHRTPPELAQLEQEDKTEREWLAKSDQRAREGETEREAEAAAEPARESGTQEWKEARGEAGPGSR
ncbi:Transglutaminase/protease-like protein, partial [Rhizoctonia solani]